MMESVAGAVWRRRVRHVLAACALVMNLSLIAELGAWGGLWLPVATAQAETIDPFVAAKATELGNDPAQIFAFVRDQIGLDPYRGSLRGARGTLWTGAGNSLDKSTLLVALLHAAGVGQTRYVHGHLDGNQMATLIDSMFDPPARVRGCIPAGSPIYSPAFDGNLQNDLFEHYWVELDTGSGFTPADPTFPGSQLGQGFSTALDRFTDLAGVLPAEAGTTIRLRLDAEIYDQASATFGLGNGLGTVTVLDQSFKIADIAGKPLSLGFLVAEATGGVPPFTLKTNTYTPYLVIGQVDADIGSDPFLQGTQFQEIYTNFPLSSRIVSGLVLHIDTRDGYGTLTTSDRTIYDRIGFAARQSGALINLGTLDQGPVTNDFDVTTINVMPGRQSLDGFAAQRDRLGAVQQQLAAIEAQVQSLTPGGPFTADQLDLLRTASTLSRDVAIANAELATMAYNATADRAIERLAAMYLVHPWFGTARLTLALSRKQGDNAALELDVLKNDLRLSATSGQNRDVFFRFEVARGLVESVLEGAVLAQVSGQATTSIGDVLQVAVASGELAVVTPLNPEVTDSLLISDEARARIAAALARNQIVIAPTHMLSLGGSTTIGWLETDSTGHTISEFEHGGHQAIVNYTGALEFSAEFNKPFANFIGRISGYGLVGYLYASAVVDAAAQGGNLDGVVGSTKDLIEQAIKQSEALNKVFEDMKKQFEKWKQDTTGFGFIGDMADGLIKGFEDAKKIFTYFTPGDPEMFSFLVPALGPAPAPITPNAQPGVHLSVTPDPMFTFPFDGTELPTAFILSVQNTGPATDRFNIFTTANAGNFNWLASPNPVVVKSGETAEISLCLTPPLLLPPAASNAAFSIGASSTINGGVFASVDQAFTVPDVIGLQLTADPGVATTTPGVGVPVSLGLRASGNQPVDVDLTFDLPAGLSVSGATTPVTLAGGQVVTQQLLLTPQATLGTDLVAEVIAQYGPAAARQEVRTEIVVRALALDAACIDDAATTARNVGKSGLADVLTALGAGMSALAADPADAAGRSNVVALLGNVIFQMDVPLLANAHDAFQTARDQLAAAVGAGQVAGALAAIGTDVCGLNATLGTAQTLNMALLLSPSQTVILPQTQATFTVFLSNQSQQVRSYNLALGALPAGVTGSINTSTVTLAPGQGTSTYNGPQVQVTITPTASAAEPFDFTLTATDLAAPSNSRTAVASLGVRDDFVRVVQVMPSPRFANPGDAVNLTSRIYNAVNKPRSVNVVVGLLNASNQYWAFPAYAGTVPLTTLASIVDFDSMITIPASAPSGPYQIEVSLTDQADGQPIPGALLRMPFFVGAPISGDVTVEPDTVAPGNSVVQTTLTIDREHVPNPTATIVGALQTAGIARDVIVTGNLAYVCSSDRISIVDVTDHANPMLVGTFAQDELGADFEVVGCTLYNSSLVVVYAQIPNPPATELSIYDLSSPLAPTLTSHVSLNQRIGGKVAFTDGSFGFLPTSLFFYNPFSRFIFQQYGDLLSIDLTNLANPSVAGRLFPAGDPEGGGPNMIFGAAGATGQTGLVTTTTAVGDGFGTGPGEGRLLSVDLSMPTTPTIAHETLIPEARLLHGISLDGSLALVAGDTLGFYDALSGFTGNLTLSAIDVSTPQSPVVRSTIVTHLGDTGGTPVLSMGGSIFAVAGSTIGNTSEIMLVDASNPASLRFVPYDLAVPIRSMTRSGTTFYAIGDNGLTIFELGSVDGPKLTARVEVPRGTGIDLVPGSFSLAPTQIVNGPSSDTYIWDQPPTDTIQWSQQLTGMQVGEVRPVTLGGRLDAVLPAIGSVQVPLAAASVAAEQIIGVSPAVQNEVIGAPVTYTVTIKNPRNVPVDFDLTTSGVPASWIQVPATVQVGAMASLDVPLVLTSALNTNPYTLVPFSVTARMADGTAGTAFAQVAIQGQPDLGGNPNRAARGAVISIDPPDGFLGPGTSASTLVHLTNTGNVTDTFYLIAFATGTNVGFTGIPSSAVTLQAGDGGDVRLIASAPFYQAPGDYDAAVQVWSNSAGFLAQATWHLHISGIGVSVSLTPSPGTTSTVFHMGIRNDGTSNDTFDLSVAGQAGPFAALDVPSVTLPPTGFVDVPITLTAPLLSLPGNMILTAIATSRTDPSKAASANAQVTLDAQKGLAASFAPATLDLAVPGAAQSVLAVSNLGNVADHYHVAITGISGPLSASLIGLDGQPASSISGLYLAGFANGAIPLQATLGMFGQGQVTVDIVSETDAQVHAHAIVTIETTGGPSATPTPTVTPRPTEDCFNCIDDDGNGLTDRADPACAAYADGNGQGVAGIAKTVTTCQKAIRLAGLAYGTKVYKRLQRCTTVVAKCLQEKASDAKCLANARATCAKQANAITTGPRSGQTKLYNAIVRACSSLPYSSLTANEGLGYGAEAPACAAVGTSGVATLLDVFLCVEGTHRCRAAQSLGAEVPRTTELLGAGEIATLLACPMDGADAGGLSLGDATRGKAVDRCQAALGAAGVKLVRAIAQSLQACSDATFRCIQLHPGDTSCLARARSSCAKAVSRVDGGASSAQAKFQAKIAKVCAKRLKNGMPAVVFADILATSGIGYQAFESQCAALGVPALASVDDISACLVKLQSCRAEQMLSAEMPRAHEMLDLAGVGAP